jgi:hypothetical protein
MPGKRGANQFKAVAAAARAAAPQPQEQVSTTLQIYVAGSLVKVVSRPWLYDNAALRASKDLEVKAIYKEHVDQDQQTGTNGSGHAKPQPPQASQVYNVGTGCKGEAVYGQFAHFHVDPRGNTLGTKTRVWWGIYPTGRENEYQLCFSNVLNK